MIATERLATMPLVGDLSPAARAALAVRAVERTFGAGEVLWSEGDEARGLLVVLDGQVRIVRGRHGRQHVVHVEGPGGTLGDVALFAGGRYPATAIAAMPTRCLVLDRAGLEAAIAADPVAAWLFLGRLARRVREVVERLDRVAAQPVPARLAAFLLARSTRDARGRTVAVLGMTQGQLAEELGTVREVVVRALRALRTAGAIAGDGRNRFVIRDALALRRLAGD